MTETCKRCGRARPNFIADPTCPKGGGYCDWEIDSKDLPVADRIDSAYRLLDRAEECEDAESLLVLCIAARKILKPSQGKSS